MKIHLWLQAIRVYTKIQGPPFQRNYVIARDQKSDLHDTSSQSSPKINRMLITRPIKFAYNESLLPLIIAVLLIKILLFFFLHFSFHLFQSNQRFQAIEFVDGPVLEKL